MTTNVRHVDTPLYLLIPQSLPCCILSSESRCQADYVAVIWFVTRGPVYKISYDNPTIILQLTCDYTFRTSFEEHGTFLRYDSLAKCNIIWDSVHKLAYDMPKRWDGWPSSCGYTISVCNQPTRSTQPCIPPGSLNWSTSFGWGMSALPGGR